MRAFVFGCCVFAVYLATLADGLQGGDAGELAVAAAHFSVAHPPGYPLYVLVGRVVSALPWGGVAAKLNLLSALCMSGAAALIARAVQRQTGRFHGGVIAGGLFAFSALVWTWGTEAEVFSLNALLGAFVIWCAVERRFSLLGFALGVGLGNHQTLLLLGLPLLFVRPRLNAFLWCGVGITAIYGLLPLMQVIAPAHSWGDSMSVAGFVHQLTRGDYGSLRLGAAQSASAWPGLAACLGSIAASLLGVGVVLACWGLLRLPHRLGPALLAAWLLLVVGFHLLARFPVTTAVYASVLARFWILPTLIACFVAGIGAARTPLWMSALVLLQLATGWQGILHTRPPVAEAYARAVLDELPRFSILLTRGDLAHNALVYVHTLARLRPDVVLLDQELMTYPWYVARQSGVTFPAERYHPHDGFTLAQFIDANRGRPIFVVGGLKPGDASISGRFVEVPYGFSTRLVPPALESAALREVKPPAALPGGGTGPWQEAYVAEYRAAKARVALALLRGSPERTAP